ncbi:MAG: hypothetical protein GX610_10415 [Rhodococcus sp.]|nr:hypothetical protein [Rhodococcus sp. (in: high G+C Gram-positive bacteria)]
MTEHRPLHPRRSRRRAALAAGGFALALVVTGCGNGGNGTVDSSPAPEPSSQTSPPSTEVGEVPGGVTATQAQNLCSELEKQLQSWRTYTPTIGKAGLNGLVGEWITRNGLDPIAFLRDKSRIDTITQSACPDIREGAISALELPDLAAGLIGL